MVLNPNKPRGHRLQNIDIWHLHKATGGNRPVQVKGWVFTSPGRYRVAPSKHVSPGEASSYSGTVVARTRLGSYPKQRNRFRGRGSGQFRACFEPRLLCSRCVYLCALRTPSFPGMGERDQGTSMMEAHMSCDVMAPLISRLPALRKASRASSNLPLSRSHSA